MICFWQCPLITKPWKRKLSRKGGGTLEINLRIKHNCHVHIPADEISLSFKLKKFYWLDLSSGWKSDRFCTQNPARPNALCGKVMFLHLSVILFIGGGGVLQTPPRWTPPPQDTATAADGTHPTWMHSCYQDVQCFIYWTWPIYDSKTLSFTHLRRDVPWNFFVFNNFGRT